MSKKSENHLRTKWRRRIFVMQWKRGLKLSWLKWLSHEKAFFKDHFCAAVYWLQLKRFIKLIFGRLLLAQRATTLWWVIADWGLSCEVWARVLIKVRFSQNWAHSCYFKGNENPPAQSARVCWCMWRWTRTSWGTVFKERWSALG